MIRLRSWEYWPVHVIYFPIFFYWIWLSIRARSFFFFSASNPTIESGGMLGESKFKILELIPEEFKPKTLFFHRGVRHEVVIREVASANIGYPLIAKPDVGERGWLVKKIVSEPQLIEYVSGSPVEFIIQEYIDLPVEAGVFYYRMPDQDHGEVSSIVLKDMLTVTGDGRSTIRELMLSQDRAKLQVETLQQEVDLDEVLEPKEHKELMPIGNHCLGTTFLNGNHLINEQLTQKFDQLSKQVSGFYYGRYDLKCASYQDLINGNIKIMELNGAGAEPAHIYHPGFSILEAYRVLFQHWSILGKISRANNREGVGYMTFREAKEIWTRIRMNKAVA